MSDAVQTKDLVCKGFSPCFEFTFVWFFDGEWFCLGGLEVVFSLPAELYLSPGKTQLFHFGYIFEITNHLKILIQYHGGRCPSSALRECSGVRNSRLLNSA